jgi:hypothetical protein
VGTALSADWMRPGTRRHYIAHYLICPFQSFPRRTLGVKKTIAGSRHNAAITRWAWSWDALDFDSDGWDDLHIVNGMLMRKADASGGGDLEGFFWRQVVGPAISRSCSCHEGKRTRRSTFFKAFCSGHRSTRPPT